MLYPLKFEPVYKNIIWGGRNIEKKFGRKIPDGNIAESWEACCRSDGMSVVSNGFLKGKTLDSIIGEYKEQLLGYEVYNSHYDVFPLLIKIIDANDKLSVQVHPDDEYAFEKENGEKGKTEMWYIIDAKPDAKLIYGLKDGTTQEEFIEAIKNNNVEDFLNEVPVKPGDVFYIPAGTVHAILDGILIAEIQQNSNITYRLYDWNRVDNQGNPRELHIQKALDVIDFSTNYNKNYQDLQDFGSYSIKKLASNKYFTTEEIIINGAYESKTDASKFFIYMFIEGQGTIKYMDGEETIKMGDTILIPSSLGKYRVSGNLKMLRIYV